MRCALRASASIEIRTQSLFTALLGASVRAVWVTFIHTETNSAPTGVACARTAAAAVGVEAFFVQTEATFVCVEVPLVRASRLFAFLGEPTEDGNI